MKMYRDGAPVQFSQLREGDMLTATIVTTLPPKVMTEQEVNATLAKAAPASGGATRSDAFDVEPGGGSRRGARRVARAKAAAEDGKRLAAARAGQRPVDCDGPGADRSPALRPLGHRLRAGPRPRPRAGRASAALRHNPHTGLEITAPPARWGAATKHVPGIHSRAPPTSARLSGKVSVPCLAWKPAPLSASRCSGDFQLVAE